MAKQRGGESGVVAANRRLSDIQGAFQDRGGQFMTGYQKSLEAKKQREARNKETQNRVNGLMDQFKNDIDVFKFKPEDQTLVKNTIAGWRQEYADAAGSAAKIQDKTSAEYQQYVDVMNDVKNRMTNLKGNLDNLSAFKGEYKENIDGHHYSNAGANTVPLEHGEVMFTGAIGSISTSGDLMFTDADGAEFSFQDYEMPFEKATGLASALGAIANPLRSQKAPIDNLQKEEIKEKIDALISDPKALASLVSDSDLPAFDFSNIDPDDPNAKQQVANLLYNSIIGLRGSGLTPATNTKPGSSKIADSDLATKLDKMLQAGIPATISGVKFTPIKEPYGDFKEKLANLREEVGVGKVNLTAENLDMSEEDFDLFMDWYNGDVSDEPIFQASIGGELVDFTYSELMDFYAS